MSKFGLGVAVCKLSRAYFDPFGPPCVPDEMVEKTDEKEREAIEKILEKLGPIILKEVLFERNGKAEIEICSENVFFLGAWTKVVVRGRIK